MFVNNSRLADNFYEICPKLDLHRLELDERTFDNRQILQRMVDRVSRNSCFQARRDCGSMLPSD